MNWLSKQIEIFKIARIPIRIDYSWFVIFLIYTWTLSSFYLPAVAPGMHRLVCIALGALTTLLFFVSVLGHELAHSFIARSENIGVQGITLYIFGGLSHLEREPRTPLSEFKIAIAGPGASFFISVVFYGLAEMLFRFTDLAGMPNALRHLGTVNLLLALFNLLPGFPMDGGRVLRSIIWHRQQSFEKATVASIRAGGTIAVSLICVGVVTLLMQRDWLTGVWSVVTGLMLMRILNSIRPQILQSFQQSRVKARRTVQEVMAQDITTVKPEMTVSEFVEKVVPQRDYRAFPVVEGRRLHGILSIDDIEQLPHERRAATAVRELMRPVMSEHFVERDLPIEEAARRLAVNGFGHAAVIDSDGFVVGYLSLKDLPVVNN